VAVGDLTAIIVITYLLSHFELLIILEAELREQKNDVKHREAMTMTRDPHFQHIHEPSRKSFWEAARILKRASSNSSN
jgi:hypothetical protein